MNTRPSRPLSASFTANTLVKAMASRPISVTRRKETMPKPLLHHFARTALVLGGTLVAGGVAFAAVTTGPAFLNKLVNTKTDEHTGRTTLTFQGTDCPNPGTSYMLDNTAKLKPEEAAKYVQAQCEQLLAVNALHDLFPDHFTHFSQTAQKSVSAHYDGRGWHMQFATYHLGSGRPYLSVNGVAIKLANSSAGAHADLLMPAGKPVVTARGTRLAAADLQEGDTMLVALHNPIQDSVPPFIINPGQPLGDIPAMRTFIEQSNIEGVVRLTLPIQYYNEDSLLQWQHLIPCQDAATICSRDNTPKG